MNAYTETAFLKVKKVVVPYLEDSSLEDSIEMDSDLIKDLHINSVHIVDIVIDLEDAFGIEIDDTTLTNLKTVGEIVRIMEEQASAA